MKIYIAGPMTGRPNHNAPAFDAVAAQLRALGYEAVSPPEITRANPQPGIGEDGSIDRAAHAMLCRLDLVALLDCAAVVVLEGWCASRGAKLELAVALTIGLPVFTAQTFIDEQFAAPLVEADARIVVEGSAYDADCLLLFANRRSYSVEEARTREAAAE